MDPKSRNPILQVFVGTLIGFAVGLFVARSGQAPSLEGKGDPREPGGTSVPAGRANGFRPRPTFAAPPTIGDAEITNPETSVAQEKHTGGIAYAHMTATFNKKIPEYQRVFAELGMAPEVAEKLLTQLRRIHFASGESELELQELMKSRMDFGNLLRSSMSDEELASYREYEEMKPALREFGFFEKHLAKQAVVLNEANYNDVIDLIRETKAFTYNSYDGPYDGLPNPAVGQEMVESALEKELLEFRQIAGRVQEKAVNSGLPEQLANHLSDYYAQRIEEKQQFLNGLRDGSLNQRMHERAVEEGRRFLQERKRQRGQSKEQQRE